MHVAKENVHHVPPFKCSRCGACCQSIAGVEGFEKLDSGDGVCKLFDRETRLCTVYDKRPTLCNVEKAYDELFSDQMTWEEWLQANYDACRELREILSIPEPEE